MGLPDATGDEIYLRVLADRLPALFARHQPQLAFFQAGVDAMQADSFGRCWLRPRLHTACRYMSAERLPEPSMRELQSNSVRQRYSNEKAGSQGIGKPALVASPA